MSLASIKRSIRVGTLLKLVRHDWLKPLVVNGNLGQTVIKPKISVGLVRPVAVVQSTQIALQGDNGLSYLQWPSTKNIRETANGFEIDLVGFGEFKHVMAYEIVTPKPLPSSDNSATIEERCEITGAFVPKCKHSRLF